MRGERKIALSSYTDSQNKQQPEYIFNQTQALAFAARYDAQTRQVLAEYFTSTSPNLHPLNLDDPISVMEAWLADKKQMTLDAPKVLFADNVAARPEDLAISIFCKELVGRRLLFDTDYDGQNKLMAWLREQGVLRKDMAGKNLPTAQFQKWLYSAESIGDNGRMYVTTFVKSEHKIDLTAYITKNIIGHTPPAQIQLL